MCPLGVGTSRLTHALETGAAKLWSLLIGVNHYWDENLPSLRYSAFDCQGLGEALIEATQGFPRKETIVHHDFAEQAPTLETVRASLRQIAAAAKPEDTILLYFSGHGVLDTHSQQVVLCLADTHKDDLLSTGLSLPEVLQILGNSGVHRQMLWLDACHSGDITLRGAKGDVGESPVLNPTPQLVEVLRQRATQSKGFYALLSCDQKQRSWEFPELKHGLFTYYLMRGLRGEAADTQGVIEADGLYKYIYHQTLQYIEKTNQQLRMINQQKRSRGETEFHSEYPLQTPKRIVEGVGELVLGLKTDCPVSEQCRRAIVIDGLANGNTIAMSKVLRARGDFELEYWPQSEKPWTEVRDAIQTCLRLRSQTLLASANPNPSESTKKTTTVLLYLRGKTEEIEDGEAWLVLGNNVNLSRSWLRQELRRTKTAQQIVVLDFPGAKFLTEWIEELKLGPEYGQCLIAAAASADRPEQFTQALLETLVAQERHAGLPVAGWITELQEKLEPLDIPLHAWISGVQGVIEILPKISSFSGKANSEPPSAANSEAIGSLLRDRKAEKFPNSTLPVASEVETYLPADRFQEQYSQLEKILKELIGPIAPTLLRQVATPGSNPEAWVESLKQLLPPHQQSKLEQRLISLSLVSAAQPQTRQPQMKSSNSLSWKYPSISESFVHQCEKALAAYIGPIATFLVQKALQSHPQISTAELVEILAAEIPDRQKAIEFQKLVPEVK